MVEWRLVRLGAGDQREQGGGDGVDGGPLLVGVGDVCFFFNDAMFSNS